MEGRLRKAVFLPLLLLALSLDPAGAQRDKGKGKKIKFRTVTFVTESEEAKVRGFLREGRWVFEGRFTASTEEGVLKADRGEYNEKKRKIIAEGNIIFYDERNRSTAKRIEVDLKERKATLDGDVRLRIVPKERKKGEKGEGKQERAGPVIVTCDRITYWYREKRAVTEGKVTLEQERVREGKKVFIRATAERAEYRTEKKNGKRVELVILEGNVRFEDSEGQYLTCKRLIYSLTEEKLEVEGLVEARFKMKEEEKREGGTSGQG